jgi:CHAT domain-containing protein/tetratricopeptide (TPR) repeat protein
MRWRTSVPAMLLLAMGLNVHAATYDYRGDVEVTAMSGAGCTGPRSAILHLVDIYIRDDAKPGRYTGYIASNDYVERFNGDSLGDLQIMFAWTDLQLAKRMRLSLGALGGNTLTGEMHAEPVAAETPGCYFDAGTFNLTRITDGPIAESFANTAAQFDFLLGDALDEAGRYAEAEPLLRHALEVDEHALNPDNPKLAPVLRALGRVLLQTGHYAESEVLLRRALTLAEHAGSDRDLVLYLVRLSDMLFQVRRYGEAEVFARRALDIAEHDPQPQPIMIALTGGTLANVLTATNRFAEAEPYRRRAAAIREKQQGPDAPPFAVALTLLGGTLVQEHKLQEAEPILERSIKIFESKLGPNSAMLSEPLNALAGVKAGTDRVGEAQPLLQRAYRLSSTSGAAVVWVASVRLMRYYADPRIAQPSLAIYYGKQAINTLQSLRGNLNNSAGADASFIDGAAPAYRHLADLLMKQGRLSEAQQVLAMLKEQELFDFTQRGGDSDPRKTSVGLDDAEQRLAGADTQYTSLDREAILLQNRLRTDGKLTASDQARLTDLQAKLAQAEKTFRIQEAVVADSSNKQLDALDGKAVSLGQEYAALKDKFKQEGDRMSSADRARLVELRKDSDQAQAKFEAHAMEVANGATDPLAQKLRKQEINDFSRAFQGTLKEMGYDAVMAQYFILDDKVAILLTTPNAVVPREALIKREDLNALIRAYRKTLSDPNQNPLPKAAELYQLLIGPIAEDLRQAGAKTLMLDLDDTLRYLPFAALYDGKQYLIESMSVVMVTEAVRDKLARVPNTNWSVWGLGITKGGPGYSALPWVDVELNGITGQHGVLEGKVMLDKAFNKDSLRDGLDQSYSIIHIASHFQFTPGSMDDSFLLLGDGSRLTLAQIKTQLNFNSVELLTLSACETALGDDGVAHHGIEVEGLGAIAQQAGARAVLATLWPVADESTATLMRTLYKEHKEDHVNKAEALRLAQMALLHGTVKAEVVPNGEKRGLTRVDSSRTAATFKTDPNAPYGHPYYWAPFVLMGNWL